MISRIEELNFKCHLCVLRVNREKFFTHLYNACESVAFWWHKIGVQTPMSLREMLAPVDTSYENIRNLSWFVKVVQEVHLVRHREAGNGNILAPLLN